MTIEQSIEAILDKSGPVENAAAFFNTLSTEQPGIFTFLFDSDTQLLTDEEHDYLLFISMVILESATMSGLIRDEVEIDTLEDMAEHNWGLLEHTGMDVLVEGLAEHPGYALYAFLEESCLPGEDGTHELLSDPAIELVFVKCKSVIDSIFLVVE